MIDGEIKPQQVAELLSDSNHDYDVESDSEVENEIGNEEADEREDKDATDIEEEYKYLDYEFTETISELETQLELGLHRCASVAVYVAGRKVLDFTSGSPKSIVNDEIAIFDDQHPPLFRAFSCGKTLVAATIWRLIDAGAVDIDAPVAKYWPEFAQRRKSTITVRHALTHSAGLPYDFARADADWVDWGRMCDIIASIPTETAPGSVIQYHTMTFGWIVGELAAHATGLSFTEAFEREVKNPLKLNDTHFTISNHDHNTLNRIADLAVASEFPDQQMPFKMQWLLDTEVNAPGGSCISTASDLARLLATVSNRGKTVSAVTPDPHDGQDDNNNRDHDDDTHHEAGHGANNGHWLSPETASDVHAVHMHGYDIEDMTEERVGQGVWRLNVYQPNRAGAPEDAIVFGHGGMGTSIVWGDPDANVGFACLTDTLQPEELNYRRLNRISAAVRRDLGLETGQLAQL